MVLKDAFYRPAQPGGPTRAGLGLAPDRPTALIMFGGNGSLRATQTILGRFHKADLGVQSIVMCGRNTRLLESLRGRPGCHPVGFVDNVADYMRIADFFIGKPGPGSLSEAVHMGCPVIVERNTNTLPQERANVEWVRDNGLGIVVRSFRADIARAGARMIRDLKSYKANIRANIPENRAVHEIVEVLERILSRDMTRATAITEERRPDRPPDAA
jgi:1,2-diacylglycerol 3-beta-galactosyltransferase